MTSKKKNIVYCMETIVDGLIKIGTTGDFKRRMELLERDGYHNVTGLKRRYARKFDGDAEKIEHQIHEHFSYCRVGKSELFALDIGTAIEEIKKIGGTTIYPETKEEEQKILEYAEDIKGIFNVPNGTYYLFNNNDIIASMKIDEDKLIVLKGSHISLKPVPQFKTGPNKALYKSWKELVDNPNIINDDEFITDYDGFKTVSRASGVLLARFSNGWNDWKTKNKKPICEFRNK